MAERFRDLVRPALVDVAARGTSSGGAQAAAALGEAFASFSREAANLGAHFAGEEGARAGAEAGAAGDPEFKRGFASLTAYGKAYNNSALRSYAIMAEADLNETAARLEAQAGTDPEKFREAMEQVRKGVLSEAPVEARDALNQLYTSRTGAGLSRIQVRLVEEVKEENKLLADEKASQLIESVSFLRAQDDEEAQQQSDVEEAKLHILLDALEAEGTYTEVEARIARKRARRAIIQQTVLARFGMELDDVNGDPIAFITDLKDINKTNKTLTPEEEEELENSLMAELRERNALRNAQQSEENAEAARILDEGDREMTARYLAGELSTRQLEQAVRDQRLDPAVARTLANALSSPSAIKSDPDTLLDYEVNLLSKTRDEILSDSDLSHDDKSRLVLKLQEESQGWKSTQHAREAFDRIDRVLGILPGTNSDLLTDEEKRARNTALTRLYNMVDAMEPEERTPETVLAAADEVIRKTAHLQAINDRDAWLEAIDRMRNQLESGNLDERAEQLLQEKIRQAEQDVANLNSTIRGNQ